MKKHIFIKKWKKYNRKILMAMYPSLSKEEINNFLDKQIEENIKNPNATIHNNYVHKSIDIDLLSVIDWIEETKPIMAGFGVLYNNQNKTINPNAKMLESFLFARSAIKKNLKKYTEGTFEYKETDRKQLTEKINANSYYGGSGSPKSVFFNIYTATSTTATGQSLTSTTATAFEAFLSNNILFFDLDDCFDFLIKVVNEKHTIDDRFLPYISLDKIMKYIKTLFMDYKDEYTELLFNYLSRLPQNILNRIYFKNNIYEFTKISKIRLKMQNLFYIIDDFKNPNSVPENSKEGLSDLWDYYREFVFHNYFAFDRIKRFKTMKRKAVVGADTDSNMVYLDVWYNNIKKIAIDTDFILSQRDENNIKFIIVNIASYLKTQMITENLNHYTKRANILKEYRSKINMKNELYFTRVSYSDRKKCYVSSNRLREGVEFNPEKIDLKGVDFMKASTREDTKNYFEKILKEKIMYVSEIKVNEILDDLEKFQDIITNSLLRGEKNFLIPKSVKEVEAYKDPFKEQGIRAVIAWNYIYPDMTIQLPEKIDIVKVNMTTLDDIEDLQDSEPEIYNNIKTKIFENNNTKISKKGVSVIAIPSTLKEIPSWILPYIDITTIVNDNISRFHSVLISLGIQTIKTSKYKHYTNIIEI